MKKAKVLLCGVAAALLMTGCGDMPDLTQDETELISEYAVGVLLKYDTGHGRRLVDTSGYEEPVEEEEPAPEEPAEDMEEESAPETQEPVEVVDVSQDEEETQPAEIGRAHV